MLLTGCMLVASVVVLESGLGHFFCLLGLVSDSKAKTLGLDSVSSFTGRRWTRHFRPRPRVLSSHGIFLKRNHSKYSHFNFSLPLPAPLQSTAGPLSLCLQIPLLHRHTYREILHIHAAIPATKSSRDFCMVLWVMKSNIRHSFPFYDKWQGYEYKHSAHARV